MAQQTLTAFFDTRAEADEAALQLQRAGLPDTAMTVSPEGAGDVAAPTPRAKGFWAALEELFGGTDDHATFAEGVRRGAIMLTVHANDVQADEAVRILERTGSVDLDEREAAWRNDGWTGAQSVHAAPAAALSATAVDAGLTRGSDAAVRSASLGSGAAPSLAAAGAPAPDDVLRVAEERLSVGKRVVNRGRVRIHARTVSTPVTQSITLRDETLTVERRPVDRTLEAAEVPRDAFGERTLEAEEIDEEAVVSKTTRLVEEISLRKDVVDRVQTVTDTVRHTEVDITDDRAPTAAGATPLPRAGMDVVGADGALIGVVERVDGTTFTLKAAAGGRPQALPLDAAASVSSRVMLKVSAAEAARQRIAAG